MKWISAGNLRGFCACTFAGLGLLAPTSLHAQPKVLRVDPQATGAAIQSVHGPHIALYDPQAPSNHRLFVFFVGTGGRAENSLTIDSAFARMGYHAIGLDYEDNVLAATCVHSGNLACFDRYRDAIVTGAPGSEKISVTPANSILNRLEKLLGYLVEHDPEGGWGEFVNGGQPAWSRIVVAGHSQGSGHAAYIAKLFKVDKVLMFSGPQDYLADLDRPAPWQSRPGATPPSRFFAFLNVNDPFNVQRQIANCAALMGLSKPGTLMVEPGEAIHGEPQILVNDIEAKRAHGSTITAQFENVWRYLGAAGNGEAGVRPSPPVPPQPTPAH